MTNIIIITGAANGIGRQIAKDLDSNKNVLCLFDIDKKLLQLNKELKHAEVNIMIGDSSKEQNVKKFISQIFKKYNKIDALINGAGIVPYCPLEDIEFDFFMNVIKINLGGYLLFAKGVSKIMKNQGYGNIINISSISSIIGISGQTAYASSKGGINSLTRMLAKELGGYGIRVNAIAPGSIIVPRNKKQMLLKWQNLADIKKNIPIGRLGDPKDISGVVKFLLSKNSEYIHGTTIVVDGGMTINGV